jgi:hypothetical protein
MIQQRYIYFKNWFINQPLVMKLGASIVINLVLGLSVGGVAEWATYKYAVLSNIRPPFEGIPYLSVVIIGLGISAVLVSAILITATSTFFSFVGVFVQRFILVLTYDQVGSAQLDILGGHQNKLLENAAQITGTVLLCLAFISLVIWWFLQSETNLLYFTVPVTVAGLAFLDIEYKWIKWLVFLASIVVIYVSLTVMLLVQSNYESALVWMRYGGSIPVVVHLDCVDSNVLKKGVLILRTTNAFIMRTEDGFNREYPASTVCAIDYLDSP